MKGFTWIKLYEQARGRIERALAEQTMLDFEDFLDALSAETVMNGGNYTRGNSEDVLIATRGAGLERVSASVKQVVYSCRGEHSEKPAEVRFRLEELYGSVARIELFSRGDADAWHHWGNENPFNDIELVPATIRRSILCRCNRDRTGTQRPALRCAEMQRRTSPGRRGQPQNTIR